MRYLTTAQYDRVVCRGLEQMGTPPEVADRIIASRWPMGLDGLLAECAGRGIRLTVSDVEAYLLALSERLPQLPPIEAHQAAYNPTIVDDLLAWCVESMRGEPSFPTVGQADIVTAYEHIEAKGGR